MKKFTPKPVKVKAVFRMTCRSKNGIEDIKEALRKGFEAATDEIPLQIQIIAAPKYWIQTTTINFVKGEEVITQGLKKIKDFIEAHEGKFQILEAPNNNDKKNLVDSLLNKPNYSINDDVIKEEEDQDDQEGIQFNIDEKKMRDN